MLISNKISPFVVDEAESVLRALEKINNNKKRVIFVVDERGVLLGSFSDGDFRRWLTTNPSYDLQCAVGSLVNSTVISFSAHAPHKIIEAAFKPGIDLIPLLDDSCRVVAVALQGGEGFTVGKRLISDDSPAFIIAEIGNNHNGDLSLAKRLVDLAFEAGADCVKFQMRDVNSLYKSGGAIDESADLGAQYTMDLLKKFQLSNAELIEVFDHCRSLGLTPLCTPWDLKSLSILEEYGMEAYKVASADFTNHQLLGAIASTGKPIFCSTGMSTEAEIRKSIQFLRDICANFVVLHCNSTYPTPFKDVNLAYLKRLQEISGGVIGYSGHERGGSVPVAAVALGAKVIEKHFTVDKSMEGNDHKVSLLPEEFRQMVRMIREVEESMGVASERLISQGELINRETLAKSLVASRSIAKGELIQSEMVEIKSPGQGLQPMYIDELLGKYAKRNMLQGDFFYESDLQSEIIEAREYKFKRPFGIPVRYHDFGKLATKSNFNFVEFHLSYQDLELNPIDFFSRPQSIGFAVHSPELFAGDHIMDLASEDEAYLERSVMELNRVCEITRKLKDFFPKTDRPVIVINAGGFSPSDFYPKQHRSKMYKRIAEALSRVNQSGVEIVIQTMPPFPWHFGGQSYHNLFVAPDEIHHFCQENGYRICYDISHSMMACNYYGWRLTEFTAEVGKFVAHIHVVDAKGVDGEGVQIGLGDVDFIELAKDLDKYAPNTQFIPEVWQGHKNQGEGFWSALNFLEGRF